MSKENYIEKIKSSSLFSDDVKVTLKKELEKEAEKNEEELKEHFKGLSILQVECIYSKYTL
ncbi:hypothetical protein [Tenacibaculum halocynthiae]|uniref:hypothetical protein n=1 Tax=Tenacibaculum halocynthiae TaxID=1254437 RepID=UPI00389545B3